MNHGHTGHVRFLTSEELGPENGGSGSSGGRNAIAAAAAGRTATGAANPRLHGRKDPTAGEDLKGIFCQLVTLEKAEVFGT